MDARAFLSDLMVGSVVVFSGVMIGVVPTGVVRSRLRMRAIGHV
jgi:hypothetical protein